MIPTKRWSGVFSTAALVGLLSVAPALAQQATDSKVNTAPTAAAGATSDPQKDSPAARLMPKGMMMGPGPIRAEALAALCDPRNAGFAGWRIDRFEQALTVTEEQAKKLEDFKTASAKALETIVAACPGEPPLTPTGRLEMMEKRLASLLEAVKTLRGAFDPFYASLTDEQKAKLTADERGRGWRWEQRAERPRR
jgi:LTXXQ motif family protein